MPRRPFLAFLPHRHVAALALAGLATLAGQAGPSAAQAGAPAELRAELRADARVDPRIAELEQALHLSDTFAVIEEEGLQYGAELAREMFSGGGGTAWDHDVTTIYAADRTEAQFREALRPALAGRQPDLDAMLAFFRSDLGARIVALEISARRALLDPSVEDASLLKLEEMHETRDPRLGRIEALIAAGDLIEENVAGAMNANLAFYRGLVTGGASPQGTMTDEDMLRDVWSQEDDVRRETTEWLTQMLVMAYAPLSDDELDTYLRFTESRAGRQMNRALFEAYDHVFSDVSNRLGIAAARVLSGQDL